MKTKKIEILIYNKSKTTDVKIVDAYVIGNLAIHKGYVGKGWAITHIPSKLDIGLEKLLVGYVPKCYWPKTLSDYKKLAVALNDLKIFDNERVNIQEYLRLSKGVLDKHWAEKRMEFLNK